MSDNKSKYLPAILATVLAVGMAAPVHAQSEADCAVRDSNSTVRRGVGGAAAGAVVGGLVNNSKGARRGAVAGGAVGAVSGSSKKNDLYKRVYDDCMAGR